MEGFKKIISLGNGCDASFFTWKLGLKKDSPLDNSFFGSGVRGLEYVLNGEFKQRILNGDIVPSAEGEEVELPPTEWFPIYPIVPLSNDNDIRFPHITPSKFKERILPRLDQFEMDLKDNNSVFILADRRCQPISESDIKRLLDNCGDVLNPQRVIILSQNKSLSEHLWAKFGFSAISLTNFRYLNIPYHDWEKLFWESCFDFESAFEMFLCQYPEMEKLLKLSH